MGRAKMADNNEFYRLKLVLSLQDRLSKKLQKIDEAVQRYETQLQKAVVITEKLGNTRAEPTVKFDSAIEKQLNRTNELLEKINNKTVAPKFKDDVTPKTRQMENSLQRLTSKVWGVTVKLKDGVSSGLSRVNNALTSPLGMLGVGAGAMGVGGLITNSATKAMDFDAQISTIKALTGGKGGDIQSIRQRALELGKNTKFSALEAAQGMTELLKAGINVKDVLGDASQAALDLAAAGDLSLTEAAEIMSTSMNAFGMKDATKAANLLAGAANASATDVHELKYALSQIGPVAAGVGMNLDDVSTGLAVLAQNGLKSSDAGTSLKTMLNGLIPTTKPAVEAFSKLGLLEADGGSAFFDAKGKVKSIEQIADLLHNSMKDLTEEQRYTLLYDMFGSDAIRGGMILIKEGAEGIRKMRQEMTKFTVSSVATTKMDNAKGDIERMKGAFETFQIEALTPMLPAIREIAQALDNLFSNTDFLYAVQGKIYDISIGITNMMSELAVNKEFQNMQWGDKIVYVLDRGMEALDKWAGGEGGEQFGKVMTKLAEIGIKAFTTALFGMMKASLNAVFEGNFSGALALALGASFMGGGKILSGLFSGIKKWGKYAIGENYYLDDAYKGTSKGVSATGAVSSLAKKLPLVSTLLAGYNILSSDDKIKAIGQEAGGLGGSLGGAALGTFLLGPGVGTVIGGIGGYALGSSVGESTVEFLRNPESALSAVQTTIDTVQTVLQDKLIQIETFISETGENISVKVADIFSGIGNFIAELPNQISYGLGYLTGLIIQIPTMLDNAGEFIYQLPSLAVEMGSAFISATSEWISSAMNTVINGMSSMVSFVAEILPQIPGLIVSIGVEIVGAVTQWASGAYNAVVNWIGQIPSVVSNALSNAATAVENFVSSIANSNFIANIKTNFDLGYKAAGGHALGGIFDREHIARFAEGNKPEAVIPLSSSLRSRGLSIWQQAGEMLGINRDLFANVVDSKFAEGNKPEAVIPLSSSLHFRDLSAWQQAKETLRSATNNLFANVTNSGFTPAMAYAASGDSSNTQNNSNSFSFNGMNINIGNGKSEKETAYEIGQMILNEIKQTFDNRG